MRPLPEHLAQQLEAIVCDAWRQRENRLTWRNGLITALALHGLRQAEIAAAKRQDLDTRASVLTVRTVKDGRWRRIPLHPALAISLASYGRNTNPEPQDRLLCGRTGNAITPQGFGRAADAIERWLGQRYTMHDLRHTAATRMYEGTGDILQVMMLLGHKTLSQTHAYLQRFREVNPAGLPQWTRRRPQISDLHVFDPKARGRDETIRIPNITITIWADEEATHATTLNARRGKRNTRCGKRITGEQTPGKLSDITCQRCKRQLCISDVKPPRGGGPGRPPKKRSRQPRPQTDSTPHPDEA